MTAAVEAPNYGEVFTRRWVVEAMLDMAAYTSDKSLSSLRVIEPSVGSGAFWIPLVDRLLSSTSDFSGLDDCLRGFDLQPEHIATCRLESVRLLTSQGCPLERANELAEKWLRVADFLLDGEPLEADLVVGNPPYIRWDDLDQATAATYRHLWPTMQGRVDIYIGFFERGLSVLRPGGRLTFICADRWMRNAYGASLRDFVGRHFAVEHVWQMHNVDAFESSVSAYPAIVQIASDEQGEALVVDCTQSFGPDDARSLLTFAPGDDCRKSGSFTAHLVDGWFTGRDLWPAGSPEKIALIEHLNETFPTIEETGVKVGIGVATGSDKSYIANQSVDIEDDRKLPITMTDDIRNGQFRWGERVLLNPWTESGELVDLDLYPKLRAALESAPALKDRFVARKNPSRWYRTIDKVDSRLTGKPKLLLQDMKAAITPVLEPGGHYPHHNLYHLTSDVWDLEVLGGLLLSEVAQGFIEAYGVRMRGGTLRFQSQYLRKIRVPSPDSIAADVQGSLREAFRNGDREAATAAAGVAYGLAS